jgi:hypothetical protein
LFFSNEALLRFTENLIAFLGNKGMEKYLGTQNLKTEYDVDMMRCSHKFCLLAVKFDEAFRAHKRNFSFRNLIFQRIISMLAGCFRMSEAFTHIFMEILGRFADNFDGISRGLVGEKGQQSVAQNSIYFSLFPLVETFSLFSKSF